MVEGREVAAVVVAAGRSSRMGFDKMFYAINGMEVLRHSVNALDSHPMVDRLVLVAGDNLQRVRALFTAHPLQKPLVIVEGGETRAASVAAGVAACPGAQLVAIHDGARPFVSQQLITRVLQAAAETGAAAPGVPMRDTVKRVKDGDIVETVARESLVAVQTPQVFERAAYARAITAIDPAAYEGLTDDCMVMEKAGCKVRVVPGEGANRKITTPEDLRDGDEPTVRTQRAGHGYDVHRLVPGRALILGGVCIPYEKGLLGHSDADVVLHAVADAMLGAVALGDIGKHFPDDDPDFEGADSMVLLEEVTRRIEAEGYRVQNVDVTIVCQKPKLAAYVPEMRANIAHAVHCGLGEVSVKATTEEGLGFTGRGEAIAAHCVAFMDRRG